MTKLTDTQSILLSAASQRENGSLYPLPSTLRPSGGTAKSIATLVSAGFAEEHETSDTSAVHRTDADLRFGLFITPAGLNAIGIEDEQSVTTSEPPAAEVPASVPAPAPKRQPGGKMVLSV